MKESWRTLKLPLSPTRKFSPQNFFSSTARTQPPNRMQTPSPRCPTAKPLTPRCPTPTSSRPGSSASPRLLPSVVGLTQDQLRRIYVSKCEDLQIPENPTQESRFYKSCEKSIRNRNFAVREQELGPRCARTLGEILSSSLEFCGVDLASNHLMDSGLVALCELLVKNHGIIHLNVGSNELSADGLKTLAELWGGSDSLVSLDISSFNGLGRNRLGPAAAEALGSLIHRSRVLLYLELNDTALGDAGLESVILGLSGNSTLLRLGLALNNITAKHLPLFCKAVASTSLQELNLACNKIMDEGCKSIAEMIVGNDYDCKLLKLDLSKNEITDKGSSSVFMAVRYNPTLSHLNMEGNLLGAGIGESLHLMLSNNFALELLNLNTCRLKNGGVSHLALGLKKNRYLFALLLSGNDFTDLGLSCLREALGENNTLRTLDLSFNAVQDGSTLAQILTENTSLRFVNLKENRIKEGYGTLLVEATRLNTRILGLNLDGNHLNIKNLQELKANLSKNKALQLKVNAPGLKKQLERLQLNYRDLKTIQDEIGKKKHEKAVILNKINKLKAQAASLKNAVDPRLIELQEEYKACREKSLALSIELDQLVKEITRMKIIEEKHIRENMDHIAYIVADIKQTEKKSKKYAEILKREEFGLKRETMKHVISQLKEKLTHEEAWRRSATAKLAELNDRMMVVKNELDGIKYSESFYEERKILSPPPAIRISRRKNVQDVRKERSKTIANRRLFVFSPNQ